MPSLALGTAQFGTQYGIANDGGRVTLAEVSEIMRLAQQSGIDLLDTAIGYGEAESVLGEVGVTNWKVVTKLPSLPEQNQNLRAWILDRVEESLERLRIERLHGLLLHDPRQMHGPYASIIVKAFEDMQSMGLVSRVGVSIQDPEHDLPAVFRHMRPGLLQSPFNLLDDNLVQKGWARKLRAMDCEVHTRSAFLQGLLLMSVQKRPPFFSRWEYHWQVWHRWLKETGLTAVQACLMFVYAQRDIDYCIVGVDSVDQLRELLGVGSQPLDTLPEWPRPVDRLLIDPSRWANS